MFALTFIFFFLSMGMAVLGLSGAAGSLSAILNAISALLLVAAMAAFSLKWRPKSTCFMYPTFSCKV